jgi:hypothetical protein
MCRNLQYHVGCSGWSYTSWQGPFYPQNLTNSSWLNYYSHVFDYVEIDSSFYRIPNVFVVYTELCGISWWCSSIAFLQLQSFQCLL